MPSGMFEYAAIAHSWIVTPRLSAPRTKNLPSSHSTSSSNTSSRCAASLRALARILRATIAVAAPATGVDREA